MNSAPNWQQLGYDAAHLAIVLTLILVFLICLGKLAGRTLKECASFLRRAAKAEFTELSGLFDFGMFVIFCIFIYSHALTELVFSALGLGQLSSDPHLWNSDVKTLATASCFVASLVFVGLLSYGKLQRPKP